MKSDTSEKTVNQRDGQAVLDLHWLRNSVDHLVNGIPGTRTQALTLAIFEKGFYSCCAKRIASLLQQSLKNGIKTTMEHRKIDVPFYAGKNRIVKEMIVFLQESLANDLVGAYVHGSLGTYEEIAYSDFDALVILKKSVVRDWEKLSRITRWLAHAQSIMHDWDPLQHHGWFVLTEDDLTDYPQAYFPFELFSYAKSLLPERGRTISCNIRRTGYDFWNPLLALANRVKKRSLGPHRPCNAYELKGFLSEFMLIPALYVQNRDQKGVYKKDSFPMAKADFRPNEWAIMDDVSAIRREWGDYFPNDSQKSHFTLNPFLKRVRRQLAPRVPAQLARGLSNEFFVRIGDFCEAILNKSRHENSFL